MSQQKGKENVFVSALETAPEERRKLKKWEIETRGSQQVCCRTLKGVVVQLMN